MKINPGRYSPQAQPGLETAPLLGSPQVCPQDSLERSLSSLIEALAAWQPEAGMSSRSAVRWRPERMPLRVAVQPYNGLEHLVFQVMREWEVTSQGLVRFVSAGPSPEQADIAVVWAEAPVIGREYEVGHADRTVVPAGPDRGWITHVQMTLLKAPLIDAHLTEAQRLKRLRATVLHETGHALGLEHATLSKDVMHHQGWRNTVLTASDMGRLLALYNTQLPLNTLT